jgi:hypothetical protein
MDAKTTSIAIRAFIQEIVERLEQAAGLAKATQACTEAGNVAKAADIALDIEQPIYEATTLLNASSLIKRISET